MIRFPFFLLLSDSPGDAPVAFSSVEKMEAFLETHHGNHWHARLVNRYSVPYVTKALRSAGHDSLQFDVDASGARGTQVPLSDLMPLRNQSNG
jgi:hypothetical protein